MTENTRAIVTLTMNPAIDISAAAPSVVPAHKLRCHDDRRDPGGGGINVARVLKRLGADVLAIYPAGGISGSLLSQLVQAEGVPAEVVNIAGETRENVNIFDEKIGEQYRFVFPGPRLSCAEWHKCLDAVADGIKRGGYAIASGSLPPDVPEDFYARFARLVNEVGARAILDTSGAVLRHSLTAPFFLLKPSLRELSELTGKPLDRESEQLGACNSIISRYQVEMVALTLGAQGALLVTRNMALKAKTAPVLYGSVVGAGDSFLGALIWALSLGKSLKQALCHAIAAGASAVSANGTSLCSPEHVYEASRQVEVMELTGTGVN